jgi:hypothetical protein
MLLFRHVTKVLAKEKQHPMKKTLFTPRGLHTHRGVPKIRNGRFDESEQK